jgi:hypothetical protein
MDKFLTGDIWNKVNSLLKREQKKIACIAYVTSDKLKLSNGDTLVCDASDFGIKFGETSAKTIDYYFKKGVTVYSNSTLHSKFLVGQRILAIGSANLSKSSAETLTESAIVTTNDKLISQAKSFCHNLIRESELLTREKIAKLLRIKVVKRPFKPSKKSKTRNKKFGNAYWFIQVFPIKDKAFEKLREIVEKTSKVISKKEGIDEDDIGFIQWPAKTQFSKDIKEGDQIVIKWTNSEKTRCFVYSPSTILRKDRDSKFIQLYHDDSNSDLDKISWTQFKKKIKFKLPSRTRTLTDNEVEELKDLWK